MKRNGYPGRFKMIQKLADEAWNQFYRSHGSEHKANDETASYQWRLEASSLKAIKQEFKAVFTYGLPIEQLRLQSMDLRGMSR